MPARDVKPIAVDFGRPLPPIRALHGTNFGPLYTQGRDLSDYFRAAGFPSLRLHDCALVCKDTVDIKDLFPLAHLDESEPTNWTFGPTDDYLQTAKALDTQAIYRLGPSIEHQHPKYFVHPPSDYDKWARICCQIIRHYNEGWADGFHHDIAYWEIWNEPWHPSMWTGTQEQWFALYETASKAIKRSFPHLKLGGADASGEYAESFLAYCQQHECPMDFFCWHLYARTPKQVVESTREAKQRLENYGFGDAELNLNEWNWFPEEDWSWRTSASRRRRFFDQLASAESAAFIVATLSYLQDEPMTMTNWYAPFLGRWGMFDTDARPQKPFYAFVAFNEMLQTPQRAATNGDKLDTGLSVLAGTDDAGCHARVLVSNFADVAVSGVRLTLKNLPGGTWHASQRLLDDALDLQPAESAVFTHDFAHISFALPPGSVRLIDLRRTESEPR
ncbi:hypothetical protein ACERK3_07165 [Phycisphaerales bacterium AB-hyl4]|uniref:Glycosyl hydrolases family 39 N-terminal catalytic domain-containing protein n=1 Tax=Natronomicrosphaera hydrolytica TaxID=3242702 RepID=A0ABV4U4J2_9BACT